MLDKIRASAVQAREAGGITQHIGASFIPTEIIKKISGKLIERTGIKITIPGILAVDTPGHAAFTNLRKRGGSIADIAVLVVDISEGFMPQTREAIMILKEFKVPFVIAATKIDRVNKWMVQDTTSFLESLKKQRPDVIKDLDNKTYELLGEVSKFGFESERFDRIKDYTKEIAIVPVSGRTGEGIAELLMVIIGLAQKYLENTLGIEVKGPAKGSVMEVKDEKGLGRSIDVIIYDGTLRVGDTIVIGGLNQAIVTKIRALLEPSPLKEMRDKAGFKTVKEVHAAAGVKITAPGFEEVIAGMPLRAVWDLQNLEEVKKEIQKEVSEVMIETSERGVVLKADSLGSLEAISGMLKEAEIPIRKAEIGKVTRSDVIEANNASKIDPLIGIIISFNSGVLPEAQELIHSLSVKIIQGNVIYKILEDYDAWKKEYVEEEKKRMLEELTVPSKIRILPEMVFRASKPAIVGVEVLAGKIKNRDKLMNKEGIHIGEVKAVQDKGVSIGAAEKGMEVAVSIMGGVIGRNLKEGQELLTEVSEQGFRLIKTKLKKYLSADEIDTMKEILEIKRKENPAWGAG